MDVILDANAILADPRMQGNYFSEFFAYLRRTGSRLVLPTIVFKEVSARYPEELTKRLRAEASTRNNVRYFCITDIPKLQDVDVRQELRRFKRRLCKPAKGAKVLLYRKMNEAHIREVVRRGIKRIPPASPAGEELRDVALWLVVLQFAKETRQPLAFVAKDGGFANQNKDGLHPQLLDECERAEVRLDFYRELRDFVVKNALDQEPIDQAWFFTYVPRERAKELATAELLQLTTNRGPVQAAEVGQLAFSSGQKYKVGENSYFVESSLTGEAKVTISENPWTTYANYVNLGPNLPFTSNVAVLGPVSTPIQTPAVQNPTTIDYNTVIRNTAPSGLGQVTVPLLNLSASTYVSFEPPSIERGYRCRFTLHLSARVVNQTLQAVEPEGVDIEEIAAIEPERPRLARLVAEAGEAAKSQAPPRRAHVPRRRR